MDLANLAAGIAVGIALFLFVQLQAQSKELATTKEALAKADLELRTPDGIVAQASSLDEEELKAVIERFQAMQDEIRDHTVRPVRKMSMDSGGAASPAEAATKGADDKKDE